MSIPKTVACENYIYYFEIGLGNWIGSFHFKVINWKDFWSDRIGLKNRFLVISMIFVMKLFGSAKITSRLEGFRDEGVSGIVTNDVRITKLGLTLYLLREKYILQPDCHQVLVQSKERFGPIPFLFNVSKEHPAEILDAGMRSIYNMPLLGTDWIGRYVVREDRNHIDAALTCSWAEAKEVINRVL